jgi:hypothetical protein
MDSVIFKTLGSLVNFDYFFLNENDQELWNFIKYKFITKKRLKISKISNPFPMVHEIQITKTKLGITLTQFHQWHTNNLFIELIRDDNLYKKRPVKKIKL